MDVRTLSVQECIKNIIVFIASSLSYPVLWSIMMVNLRQPQTLSGGLEAVQRRYDARAPHCATWSGYQVRRQVTVGMVWHRRHIIQRLFGFTDHFDSEALCRAHFLCFVCCLFSFSFQDGRDSSTWTFLKQNVRPGADSVDDRCFRPRFRRSATQKRSARTPD